jgi:type I restriction enzyme S subunit
MRSETAWEVVELSQICTYRQERIEVDKLTTSNYISTANMLPNKSGIEVADNLPNTKTTSRFYVNDVLVSNIRPYFKKAWLATLDGGCSNDVLVMRALDDVYAPYLYYLLSSDQFFAYMTSTAKGTKMPRGDKDAIMRYMIQKPPLGVQKAIADILSCLDSKIELNNKINENLEAQGSCIIKFAI